MVLLFFGAFFYFNQIKREGVDKPNPILGSSSVVGCYVAKFDKDLYTLEINKEEGSKVSGMLAYNNYQKDSSSGTFEGTYDGNILLGNYSFDSEGMHSDRQLIFKRLPDGGFNEGFGPVKVVGNKETLEDLSKVTYDRQFTFTSRPDCIEHFTDKNNVFSFDYHPFFAVSEGGTTPTLDWRVNAGQKGELLASVFANRTFLPKTNFSDAKFTVGRSTDANAIKNCLVENNVNFLDKKSTTIDGRPFTRLSFTDAGAGNFYTTTSYRGVVDGDCYAIEYTVHSTNIGNYSPDQGIKEFDKSKIENEMEKIVKSFKFLINSN